MSEAIPPGGSPYAMRAPCADCGCANGVMRPRNNQDCVFCASCNRFAYNAPRTETGKEQRSVSTVHNGVSPKQRARILFRDRFSCIICHSVNRPLHVGHLLSVKSAFSLHESGFLAKPLTDEQINSDENLGSMCEECNLGIGKETIPLFLLMGIFLARLKIGGLA